MREETVDVVDDDVDDVDVDVPRLCESCQVRLVSSRPELLAELPGQSVLLCTSFDQVDGELLEAGQDLQAVVTVSAGFNHVATDLLRLRGVRLGK